MPVTVHKLLVHGYNVIKHALLPIGQLSEEAQECRHKEVKHYREHNTRKYCRRATMEDLIHTLLYTSDPLMNNLRKKSKKPLKQISAEVVSLLKAPSVSIAMSATGAEAESSDDHSEGSED